MLVLPLPETPLATPETPLAPPHPPAPSTEGLVPVPPAASQDKQQLELKLI